MIQSAVVVPEESSRPPSPSLKRRQSSLSSESSKRPRLDTRDGKPSSHGSPPPSASGVSPPQRRPSAPLASAGAEERKRSQRLFGAVFSTLSQTSAKPAHRRRDEIEKRQQDKLKQKDEELAEEKRKRREVIDATRCAEQKLWDEQGMHVRHRNMQATARFLKTETQPRLYYKPWELRDEEEDQIKRQMEETKATIERELVEYAATKAADRGMNEVHPSVSKPLPAHTEDKEQQPETSGEGKAELVGANTANHQEISLDTPITTDSNSYMADAPGEDVATKHRDEKANDDHGGEELVEGQEDSVIY